MFRSTLSAGLFLFALTNTARAAGPYDDLLKHTPPNTNTLVLIDVKGALASSLARVEKWGEKGQRGDRGGLGFIPSDAEAVVIAIEANLNTLTRDHQIGLVKVSHNVPEMRELAYRENGTVDEIAGRLAVLSPRNVYFTTLPSAKFVAMYPADRQAATRYMKAIKGDKTGQLSPYLATAVENATGNAVTIAVDLEDVIDKTLLKFTLIASPSVAKVKTADVALLAAFISGTKGMTFAAKISDQITGSFTVEFVGDPTNFKRTLPDLFRELLEGGGIAISGFGNWEAKFTEHTMTLSGPLTSSDLKRMVSLFAFPQLPGEPDPQIKGNEVSVDMTRRYLQAIDVIVTDTKALQKSPDYNKMATWHDKAADQIDHLSRRNVAPIAAEAAYESARRLRAIAESLRGVPINKRALESQQYYYSSGGGYSPYIGLNWWNWRSASYGLYRNPTYVQTNIPEIQAQIAKLIADDEKARLSAWSDIVRLMQEARRKLSDKYKTDF